MEPRGRSERVVKSDWQTLLPFKEPVTSPWKHPIEPKFVARILLGVYPLEMEDKWFIYAEGPGTDAHFTVHIYRSWTGLKIAEVLIDAGLAVSGSGPAWIKRIVWESNEEIFGNRASTDVAMETVRMVFEFFLRVRLPSERDVHDLGG
jgi:hypothetical protein